MRMRILMLSKCEQDYYGDMPSFMKLGTCQLLNKSYISSADLNQHVSNLSRLRVLDLKQGQGQGWYITYDPKLQLLYHIQMEPEWLGKKILVISKLLLRIPDVHMAMCTSLWQSNLRWIMAGEDIWTSRVGLVFHIPKGLILEPCYHTLQRKCGIRNCHLFWNKETNQSFKLPHPFPHANGLSFWRMRTHRTVHRHLRLRPTPADRFAAMEGCKHMQSIMEYKGPNPTNQLGLGSSTMLFIG